jgi:anti-sigma regulatory factor (Ser/Thr protein kinase)
MSTDRDLVILSIPRSPRYYGVARLVVGGLASGLELPYDALDDVQLAIGSLLDSDALEAVGDVTLRLHVADGTLTATLGSFDSGAIAKAFEASADSESEPELGLRRLLDTIVDAVDIQTEDDGDWITLTKRVPAAV